MDVHKMKRLLVTLAVGLFTFSCTVEATPEAVKAELAKKYPAITAERITKTTYANLYEVFTGTEIFYTDEKVTFFVAGEIIDAVSRKNVSQDRLNRLTAIPFNELPFQNAIKIVRGDGSRKMAVFEDPLCGFCKRFEADIAQIENTTIYVFLYPILAQDSVEKSKNIWCAKDQKTTWQDWMLRDKQAPVAAADCKTPLEDNVALGRKLRATGTPVTFFEDGERIVGARPREEFEAKFAQLTQTPVAPPAPAAAAKPKAIAPAAAVPAPVPSPAPPKK
jgi:thiol:disulfide interchange protein DsbC